MLGYPYILHSSILFLHVFYVVFYCRLYDFADSLKYMFAIWNSVDYATHSNMSLLQNKSYKSNFLPHVGTILFGCPVSSGPALLVWRDNSAEII